MGGRGGWAEEVGGRKRWVGGRGGRRAKRAIGGRGREDLEAPSPNRVENLRSQAQSSRSKPPPLAGALSFPPLSLASSLDPSSEKQSSHLLPLPRGPGRVRAREAELPLVLVHQMLDQRSFPDAAGAADDERRGRALLLRGGRGKRRRLVALGRGGGCSHFQSVEFGIRGERVEKNELSDSIGLPANCFFLQLSLSPLTSRA